MSAIKLLGLDKYGGLKRNYSPEQEQTKNAFGYQWSRRDSYDSPAAKKAMKDWLIERYCDNNPDNIKKWLEGGDKIIVDAGCGGGYSGLLFFGEELNKNYYLGVDISDAIYVAKKRFDESGIKGEFFQSSILELPIPDASVDMIFSEGVLHHTDNTEKALLYLSSKLKTNGKFLFYVYAKKAVIREFTDDLIREKISQLSDEGAWEFLKPLTKLGIELGKLNINVEVPENIPFLGIKKGNYDIQRFIYWNIFKAFYNPDFTLEEMNHINFDWFRPLNCFRHTKEEILKYCEKANLIIEHFNEQEAGYTVVARKK